VHLRNQSTHHPHEYHLIRDQDPYLSVSLDIECTKTLGSNCEVGVDMCVVVTEVLPRYFRVFPEEEHHLDTCCTCKSIVGSYLEII
jgi:hypothetical protein